MKSIPLLVPEVPSVEFLLPYLRQIDDNKVYSNFGPLNSVLTSRLSEHFGIDARNLVTTSNATLALQGAVSTSPTTSHVWECPSWTFTASPAAILSAGRRPIFSDIDSNWRVVFRGKSRNLMDVLPFGGRPDFDRLPLAHLDCLVVDGAASFDALQKVQLPNEIPIGIVVSMHATKALPAGEGGIFFSNDPDWVKRVRNWCNFGMDTQRISHSVGTNAKLSEYSAAVALATLDNWEGIRRSYSSISKQVLLLCKMLNLSVFAPSAEFVSPYWILRDMQISKKSDLSLALNVDRIEWRNWWGDGCHTMPAYGDYSEAGFNFTNTEIAAKTSIGLPFSARMNPESLNRIATTLKRIFSD